MSDTVVDSSVVAKWILPEADSDQAQCRFRYESFVLGALGPAFTPGNRAASNCQCRFTGILVPAYATGRR